MADPLCGQTANDGFHILKDRWCQKSYLLEQSKHLCQNLEDAIASTRKAAPSRKLSFVLGRESTDEIDETERERRWERSVFRRWRSAGLSPVTNCWERLIAFQVPLFADQEKSGWGYIDLLGIFSNGMLSVVELKKEPRTKPSGGTDSSESPLRMVLEAAAYAIALQENWNQFREELLPHLTMLQIPEKTLRQIPQTLNTVRLVGAAPAGYWLDWLPVTAKGDELGPDDWIEFQRLLDKLKDIGLPTSFVSISGDINVPGSLAAQPLPGFPLIQNSLRS